MKKVLSALFAAAILFVSAPQADAAYQYMGTENGFKYLLDDATITQLSRFKVEFTICADRGGDVYSERIYLHKVNGRWVYQGDDGVDRPITNCNWARCSTMWLINYGYIDP